MNPSGSEIAVTYIHDTIVKEGVVHPLKYVWRQIQGDYDNPCEYLLTQCHNVGQLETFLGEYRYLFMIENRRIARSTEELELGRQNADRYFEENLRGYDAAVNIEILRKHVDDAPKEVKSFIEAFYPYGEFRKYLKRRPCSFVISKEDKAVSLVDRESIIFFQKIVNVLGGMRFTSLRGHIGHAPDSVQKYINTRYPGTEFLFFIESNPHAFELNKNGWVYGVK